MRAQNPLYIQNADVQKVAKRFHMVRVLWQPKVPCFRDKMTWVHIDSFAEPILPNYAQGAHPRHSPLGYIPASPPLEMNYTDVFLRANFPCSFGWDKLQKPALWNCHRVRSFNSLSFSGRLPVFVHTSCPSGCTFLNPVFKFICDLSNNSQTVSTRLTGHKYMCSALKIRRSQIFQLSYGKLVLI